VKVFFPPPRRHRRPSRSLIRLFTESVLGEQAVTNSTRLAIAYRGRRDGEVGLTQGGTLRRATHWRHFVCRYGTHYVLLHVIVVVESPHRRVTADRVPVYFQFPATIGYSIVTCIIPSQHRFIVHARC